MSPLRFRWPRDDPEGVAPVKRTTTTADTPITVAIFLLGFGYFYLFHRLGWFMQDEGVLYYQYLRTYEGQVPYRDFYTGYPPLVYYLHAWVFAHVGISLHVLRTLMAIVNSLSAAGLYAVTRRIAPRGFALIPPALFLVMQPGDITAMVFHNSPYPSWYAVTFSILGTWTILRSLEARSAPRSAAWLLATGFLGALTFLSKQNAGIFFLWGVTGFLASRPTTGVPGEEKQQPLLRAARVAYLALIPVSALLLVKNFLGVATMTLFVVPLTILARLGAKRGFANSDYRALVAKFAWVLAGFAGGFGPWLVYFTFKVGLVPFLRGLFFVGIDVDRNLYIPFPLPMIPTIIIVAPVAIGALLVWSGQRRHRAWLAGVAGLALGLGLGAIFKVQKAIQALMRGEYGLGEIYLATSTSLDNTFAYLAPLLLAAALLIAWRQARGEQRAADPPSGEFLCVLWIAASSFLLYYPRMDAAHLIGAAPLLYAVAAGLFARMRETAALAIERRGLRPARTGFHVLCAVLIFFVVGLKTSPKIYSLYRIARTEGHIRLIPTEREWLGLERANIYMPVYEEQQRLPLKHFRELIHYIRENTEAHEPIFAFPALPMVYFVSGRHNPTRQDYFFGNNVSFEEQLEVIRTLDREAVQLVVIANNPNDYFVTKGRNFTRLLHAYLKQRYNLERRFGPYDVLRRYDSPAGQIRGRESLMRPLFLRMGPVS